MKELKRKYDENFIVTEEYKDSMPDLQNGDNTAPLVKIEQVGIHDFKLPVKYLQKNGNPIKLETSVTGTVSLEALKKGINMSRIMRTFYEYKKETFSIDLLEKVLLAYKTELESLEARLLLSFSYPIIQTSLRSNLEGYQYYNVVLEASIDEKNGIQKFIHFDFVYSSACPCSYELGVHAAETRGVAFVSHSQRSVARISIKFEDFIWIEDLRDICLKALMTETQVMVKREDEQDFAIMNAAYLKFVEDAVRLLYRELKKDSRILDFKVVASHNESLHSHNAIACLTKGIEGGFDNVVSRETWKDLGLR